MRIVAKKCRTQGSDRLAEFVEMCQQNHANIPREFVRHLQPLSSFWMNVAGVDRHQVADLPGAWGTWGLIRASKGPDKWLTRLEFLNIAHER